MTLFTREQAQDYAARTLRQVPGFADLHRMISLLIAERAPADARILVHGAGGGLEIRALADDHPGWTFDGVDPSPDMLALAAQVTSGHAARTRLHEGYIDIAPAGPFDAATSILTFHFIPRDQRLATLRRIHQRLKPGAPFVLAHISFPQTEPARSTWIARHVAFGGVSDPARAEASRQAIATRLSILDPAEEEAMLHEAGFTGASLIYAGLSFKGWIAYASAIARS